MLATLLNLLKPKPRPLTGGWRVMRGPCGIWVHNPKGVPVHFSIDRSRPQTHFYDWMALRN